MSNLSYWNHGEERQNEASSSSNANQEKDQFDHQTDSGYAGSDFQPDAIAVDGELSLAGVSGGNHRRSPSMVAQRQAASQMQQLQYNENRMALGRSIAAVLRLLKELQQMNRRWPIYYPATEEPTSHENGNTTTTNNNNSESDRKGKGKNLLAEMEGDTMEEPLAQENLPPRLVSPQVKKQFNVFKLDLKMGALSSDQLVHQLEDTAVASLLEGKIIQSMKHLHNLRDRIDDTASKVLITGDLNSGKSTFCNALLRRKLLPADQQPCTSVFCEVKDARENQGIEEVHAVYIGMRYEWQDDATFARFKLDDLEELVSEVDKYSILKVYVDDKRPVEQSLLNNGVVDITLIDAPGLNMDSYQTTKVFSRQEEIDLVVFVVSAENHFTLSAKEFISAAAHEKSLVFIVVNRFDSIKNKGKCMNRILGQVADLSPETHKDARDFVHFVSSDHVLSSMPDIEGSSSGGGGGGDDDDGDGDDDNNDPNNAQEPEDPDFDRLEASLRNFVLEKRSLSKLAPAKTYLSNILMDLQSLAEVNIKVTEGEREKYMHDLEDITPKFEKKMRLNHDVSEKMDKDVEAIVEKVYSHTTTQLNEVMESTGESPVVKYSSIFDSYNYALQTKQAIIQRIQDCVLQCEDFARQETATGVNALKTLGIMHVGNQPAFEKLFHSESMFSKKRDNLGRTIVASLSITDFVDVTVPLYDQYKDVAVMKNVMTVGSVVAGGQMVWKSEWLLKTFWYVDYATVRKLLLPLAVLASVAGAAYIIKDIPNAIPRKVSRKIMGEVTQMGYVHANADRISKKCRAVLKYPAQDVRAAFQSDIEKHARQKEQFAKQAREAEEGFEYFTRLAKQSKEQHKVVETCNLTVD